MRPAGHPGQARHRGPAPVRCAQAIAALFTISAVLHLTVPGPYERIVPSALPRRRGIVYGSGIAELACAGGLLYRPTRPVSGVASAALLVGVFPGNIQMAVNAHRQGSPALRLGTLLRLPLQAPLVWAALRASQTE